MRVAIVNDLKMALETLRRVIQSAPDLEVAWTAMDGAEAVAKTVVDPPDLVLMDLVMPEMDGVEATRRIMNESACPILVVTATVEGNARKVVAALGHGAIDAVQTPTMGLKGDLNGADPLLARIEAVRRELAGIEVSNATAGSIAVDSSTIRTVAAAGAPAAGRPMLLIGASTGGPQALQRLLLDLPKPLPTPAAIVQHIDPQFVDGLCQWLAETTGHRVVPSKDGAACDGEIVIASGDRHLGVGDAGYHHDPCPEDSLHRPSVDRLFESAVDAGLAPGVAVLLTGMGRDGASGLGRLREAGWLTLAQDEGSSVVWGMPGTAAKSGAAVEVLPLESIGVRVAQRLRTAGAKS